MAKFYVGDVDGNPGKSLVVEMDGSRRGLWNDFSTDEAATSSIWAIAGLSAGQRLPRILDEIRQWLGDGCPWSNPIAAFERADG